MLALRILGAAAAAVLAGSLFLGCESILGIKVYPTTDGAVGDDGGGTDGTSSGDATIPVGPGDGSVPGNPLNVPPPPPNNRAEFNFNYQWKFIAADVTGASANVFDDSTWTSVSLPHTFNDVDQWVDWELFANDTSIVHPYSGVTWYRKHFKLDASYTGRKVFLEFQGIRNMGTLFVNGANLGFCEDEISPCGIDITSAVQFGGDNVVAVQVNNTWLESDQTYVPDLIFDWSQSFYYSMYGGLYTDAKLIITDPIHQTLPLWRNLQTSGVYVYASNIDTLNKKATAHVEAEVYNESLAAEQVTLSVDIYDYDGKKILTQPGTAQSVVAAGMKTTLAVTAVMNAVHFWAPEYPYLYTVRSSLSVGGRLLDVTDNPLGIRTFTFSATNGFKINGHSYWLAGFSPHEVMDWPGTGIPQDWMTEYDYLLMKQANHFFVRPMHVAPRKHMVQSADRLGIVMVLPAGDSEGCTIPQWPQHLAVMQNVMIYFRNNPSVAFYEGCNSPLSVSQQADMTAERDMWDPHGGRLVGARDINPAVPYEYVSPIDVVGSPTESTTTPTFAVEYARSEAPRRVWDRYTPAWDPHSMQYVTGGYVKIASPYYMGTLEGTPYPNSQIAEYPLCDVRENSMEDQALCNVFQFWRAYSSSNFVEPVATRASAGIQIGASKVLFADSVGDGLTKDTDVARTAGVVDGARLPKSAFYAMRVAASLTPDVAILGHWNYPAGTTKTVYVIASCGTGATTPSSVMLGTYRADGTTLIKNYAGAIDVSPSPPWGGQPGPNHYAWSFPNVAFQQGVLKAAATCGSTVVTDQKVTTGLVAALKLTPRLGPKGWFADGADIAMIDVEAVDSHGLRVPTDEANVMFALGGQGVWIGGYNSGVRQSTYQDNLWTENGINRLFVRSTTTAGTYAVTASRPPLPPVTIYIASSPFPIDSNGLTQGWSQRYDVTLGTEPTPIADPN
jgi:beta-galactosidase